MFIVPRDRAQNVQMTRHFTRRLMRFQKLQYPNSYRFNLLPRVREEREREKLNIHRAKYKRYTCDISRFPLPPLYVIANAICRDIFCSKSERILAAGKFIIAKIVDTSHAHLLRDYVSYARTGRLPAANSPRTSQNRQRFVGIIAALRCILPAHFGRNSTLHTYVAAGAHRFAAAFWSAGFAREHKITAEASAVKSAI